MTKILLLSDTHSYIDPKIARFLEQAEELWHAGDIGNTHVIDFLSQKKAIFVRGNIDCKNLEANEVAVFERNGFVFLMIHIAGKPLFYNPKVQGLIKEYRPHFLICGHSHILRILWDAKHQLLYLNPGACGQEGFHTQKTMLFFDLDKAKGIKNLQIIEWPKN